MHRLLRTQLQKSFGKDYDLSTFSKEMQTFLGLVEQAYDDLYMERLNLEHILEVSSNELTVANRELRKSHELLRSVTQSIGDIIYYKDQDFKYMGCNQHFEMLTGLSEKEIIGKDDFDIFPESVARQFRISDAKVFEDKSADTQEEVLNSAGGEERYLSTLKTPLMNSKGTMIGLVGVSRDITQQHYMQEELKSKELMLVQQGRLASMGEMVGNIAHQWRQPLNALGLVIQKLRFYYDRGTLNRERLDQNIEQCIVLIDGMSNTIDDFRDFFNPQKKKEPFTLKDAIEKAYNIVDAVFASHRIDYRMEMEDEQVQVDGFKNEFSQVIVNLLNNAKDVLIEKGVEEPWIRIEVKGDGNSVMLTVCDNGGGIPAEILDRIFDPYFTTKEEGKGTGIGLYMSKTIIEEHMQGRLYVENSPKGACFEIVLSKEIR